MNETFSEVEYEPRDEPLTTEIVRSGGSLQRTATKYTTAIAVQKARKVADVERRLLEEANLAGEDFFYGWSVKDKRTGKVSRIEGPSTDLAHAAARCWGNAAVDIAPVQETHDSWIFTAVFVDLETGFTLSRQFQQSKQWTVYGNMDEERKTDVRFQIGQSKAIRNVVLNALPAHLIRKAMDRAKDGVRAKVENYVKEKGLAAAVELVVRGLVKCGIKVEAICAKFGVANQNALDIDHVVIMRGDLAAIDSGRDYPEVLYPMPKADGETKTAGIGTDGLKDDLKNRQGKTTDPKNETKKKTETAPDAKSAPQTDNAADGETTVGDTVGSEPASQTTKQTTGTTDIQTEKLSDSPKEPAPAEIEAMDRPAFFALCAKAAGIPLEDYEAALSKHWNLFSDKKKNLPISRRLLLWKAAQKGALLSDGSIDNSKL